MYYLKNSFFLFDLLSYRSSTQRCEACGWSITCSQLNALYFVNILRIFYVLLPGDTHGFVFGILRL